MTHVSTTTVVEDKNTRLKNKMREFQKEYLFNLIANDVKPKLDQ